MHVTCTIFRAGEFLAGPIWVFVQTLFLLCCKYAPMTHVPFAVQTQNKIFLLSTRTSESEGICFI